jgi:hypothetical protein
MMRVPTVALRPTRRPNERGANSCWLDELQGFGDLVADFGALTAIGLWQFLSAHSPGRAQAFGCRNAPYCLLAATAAAASPMTRIAAIMGHGPRLTRRTPTRASPRRSVD